MLLVTKRIAQSRRSLLGCEIIDAIRLNVAFRSAKVALTLRTFSERKATRINSQPIRERCDRRLATFVLPPDDNTLRGAKSYYRRWAFSLVELMAVMVILALLATATVLAVVGYSDTARATKAVTDISTLVKALDSFYTVNGRYPTNAEGLEILTQPGKGSSSGFLKKIPKDPWQNRYEYFSPGSKGPFEVISRGADKKEGGDKANRDISSESLDQE